VSVLTLEKIDQAVIDEISRKIGRIPRVTPEQAEEAVMEGLLSLYEKADQYEDRDPDALKGLLYTYARFKALSILERARRHQADSLDSLVDIADETGAGRRVLGEALTDDSFDLDAYAEVVDAEQHPILALRMQAVEMGYSSRIMGRGEHHPESTISDAQVGRVRELAAAEITQREIEQLAGVEQSTISLVMKRKGRLGTTDGWSRELVILAFRCFHEREGRTPTFREGIAPLMPGATTVRSHFGTWNDAVIAAGLPIVREPRPPWTPQRIAKALFAWRKEHGRWPSRKEVDKDKSLPTMLTIWRHWGTHRIAEVIEMAMLKMFEMLETFERGMTTHRGGA
jgi:DNA-directed RNA polymerase specialized sigma24 family protein